MSAAQIAQHVRSCDVVVWCFSDLEINQNIENKYITNDQLVIAYLHSVFLHYLMIHLRKVEVVTKMDFPQRNPWVCNDCSPTSAVNHCLG